MLLLYSILYCPSSRKAFAVDTEKDVHHRQCGPERDNKNIVWGRERERERSDVSCF